MNLKWETPKLVDLAPSSRAFGNQCTSGAGVAFQAFCSVGNDDTKACGVGNTATGLGCGAGNVINGI